MKNQLSSTLTIHVSAGVSKWFFKSDLLVVVSIFSARLRKFTTRFPSL